MHLKDRNWIVTSAIRHDLPPWPMVVDAVKLGRIPHSDSLATSPTHGPPTIRANGVHDCQEG